MIQWNIKYTMDVNRLENSAEYKYRTFLKRNLHTSVSNINR